MVPATRTETQKGPASYSTANFQGLPFAPVSQYYLEEHAQQLTFGLDWGDTISVTLTNGLTSNGTGIHWHGLRQLNTVTQDGVPGITECPLAPGDSKTYTFKATQFGTTWYHSHFSAQYGDGASGSIVIDGPASSNYDIDLGPYPVTDWYYPTV